MECTPKPSKKMVSAHVGDHNNVEKVVNSNGHDVRLIGEPCKCPFTHSHMQFLFICI